MSENKSEAFRVNVTPDVRAALEAEARRDDVSIATIVRKAIREHLATEEDNRAA